MINWKVVIGSGAVAVVLSLLTGIISGVSFGTLLLRALLWGAIFSGVGAGASVLISRFLPELFSPTSGGTTDDAHAKRTVDIVLPDENPHDFEEADQDGYPGDYVSDFEDAGEGDALDGGETERPPAAAPRSVSDNMVEELEEVREDRSRASEPAARPRGQGDELEPAEELPELQSDEADFSLPTGGEDLRPERRSDRLSNSEQRVDVLGHQADATEIANAIRTAMRKDEKG